MFAESRFVSIKRARLRECLFLIGGWLALSQLLAFDGESNVQAGS
jgi:hypothetical protein